MDKKLILVSLIIFVSVCQGKGVKRDKNKDEQEEYHNSSDFDVFYDQKQNGSENWRFDLSGVDVVVAPPASILKAILSPMSMLAILDGFSKQALSIETKKIGANVVGSPSSMKKSPLGEFSKHISEKMHNFDLKSKTGGRN